MVWSELYKVLHRYTTIQTGVHTLHPNMQNYYIWKFSHYIYLLVSVIHCLFRLQITARVHKEKEESGYTSPTISLEFQACDFQSS